MKATTVVFLNSSNSRVLEYSSSLPAPSRLRAFALVCRQQGPADDCRWLREAGRPDRAMQSAFAKAPADPPKLVCGRC